MPHCFVAEAARIVTAPLLLFLEHLSRSREAEFPFMLAHHWSCCFQSRGLGAPLPPLLKFNYLSTNPHHPLLLLRPLPKTSAKKKIFFLNGLLPSTHLPVSHQCLPLVELTGKPAGWGVWEMWFAGFHPLYREGQEVGMELRDYRGIASTLLHTHRCFPQMCAYLQMLSTRVYLKQREHTLNVWKPLIEHYLTTFNHLLTKPLFFSAIYSFLLGIGGECANPGTNLHVTLLFAKHQWNHSGFFRNRDTGDLASSQQRNQFPCWAIPPARQYGWIPVTGYPYKGWETSSRHQASILGQAPRCVFAHRIHCSLPNYSDC